ncbi:MAG: hypothetical protein WD036_03070 [Bauldia sp.]
MATLLLTAGAAALTSGAAAWVTTVVGALATVAGGYIDARLFGPGPQKSEGPRLDSLQVQASTEGAAIPEIAGRVRIAGQIIWATKFKEVAKTEKQGGKGGGGGVETTTFSYFANFAVGLCEGQIDRIGRIWADGKPLDRKGVTMRIHKGGAGQSPDSLIEGIEGSANAPAYRGTAYVVFENFAIGAFGNRMPQLNFEVFRRVSPTDGSGLEDIVEAITLIPGAGERVYDTVVETRDLGGGASAPENAFSGQGTADWNVALVPPTFVPPTVYGRAILQIMDLPLLRDADVPYAPYVATTSSPFAGVTILDSPTGDDFAVDTALPIKGTIGQTVFDFYAGPTDYFDVVNTLRVQLYAGELASASEATILSGRSNALALLNADGDWEIVQVCNADLVATGTYDLTKLLRGRLGTEHAMRAPLPAGAPVVSLDGAVDQLQAALAERGQGRFYKWGPTPLDLSDPAWQQETFTARAVGLMPWSPVHVAGVRNGSGDLSISWARRTRIGGVWADGTDIPLNEESERYEVDILNGSTVVRTIAVTSPTASYTAAQQTADFGTPQSPVAVRIYQLSATVGRGWPAAATL